MRRPSGTFIKLFFYITFFNVELEDEYKTFLEIILRMQYINVFKNCTTNLRRTSNLTNMLILIIFIIFN